jgi:hypothetical protein
MSFVVNVLRSYEKAVLFGRAHGDRAASSAGFITVAALTGRVIAATYDVQKAYKGH